LRDLLIKRKNTAQILNFNSFEPKYHTSAVIEVKLWLDKEHLVKRVLHVRQKSRKCKTNKMK